MQKAAFLATYLERAVLAVRLHSWHAVRLEPNSVKPPSLNSVWTLAVYCGWRLPHNMQARSFLRQHYSGKAKAMVSVGYWHQFVISPKN